MTYKITRAEATYTGGNIYIFTGQLEDGRFFQTADEWEEDVMILDADPNENWDENSWEYWQKAHTVEELVGMDSLRFWVDMLKFIISNDNCADVGEMESRMEYVTTELAKGEPMKQYRVHLTYSQNATVEVDASSVEEAKEKAETMDMDNFDWDDGTSDLEITDVESLTKLPFTGDPLYQVLKLKVKELVRNTLSEYGIDWIDDLSFSNRHFIRHDTAMLAKTLQLALENPSADMDDTDD